MEGEVPTSSNPELYNEVFPPDKKPKRFGRPPIYTPEERRKLNAERSRRWREQNKERVKEQQAYFYQKRKDEAFQAGRPLLPSKVLIQKLEEENERLKQIEQENQRLKQIEEENRLLEEENQRLKEKVEKYEPSKPSRMVKIIKIIKKSADIS